MAACVKAGAGWAGARRVAACDKAGAGVVVVGGGQVDINAVNRSIAASILSILSNIRSSVCVVYVCN